MDNQNPVIAAPENTNPPLKKPSPRYLIVGLVLVVLMITIGLVTGFFQNIYNPKKTPVIYTPSATSKPVAVPSITTLRGIIIALDENSITIRESSASAQTFAITEKTVIQKVPPIQNGAVVPIRATKSDLATNQDVTIVTDKGNFVARTVLISE